MRSTTLEQWLQVALVPSRWSIGGSVVVIDPRSCCLLPAALGGCAQCASAVSVTRGLWLPLARLGRLGPDGPSASICVSSKIRSKGPRPPLFFAHVLGPV